MCAASVLFLFYFFFAFKWCLVQFLCIGALGKCLTSIGWQGISWVLAFIVAFRKSMDEKEKEHKLSVVTPLGSAVLSTSSDTVALGVCAMGCVTVLGIAYINSSNKTWLVGNALRENRNVECKWIYERSYIWTAEKNTNLWLIIAVIHRTKAVVKLKPKQIQTWTGFEQMTSVIPMRCSTNGAIKPSRSWLHREFIIYSQKGNSTSA